MDSASDKPLLAARRRRGGVGRHVRPAARPTRKVPELTAYFWITKVLTTGMGEAASDYLVHRFVPEIAVAFGAVALLVALVLQFSVDRYVPWIYWLAVAMVAVFGTMAADVLHVQFKVSYAASTALFTVVLAVVFVVWNASEKTLSIHSINTPRREAFYWATVMATFALGTAAGDLTATTLHLGFLVSGVMFAALIAAPGLAYRLFGLNEIFAFWFAYIVTRPLGASFADYMDKGHALSGLGWGNGPVSLGLTVLLVGCVAYLSITHIDVRGEDPVTR